MKTMKRIASMLLAVMLLVCVMAVPANAASITILSDHANHTYMAYQIFDGTLAEGRLTSIQWGTGVDQTLPGFAAAFEDKTAADIAKSMSEESHAIAFADKIAPFLSNTYAPSVFDDENDKHTITGLDAGYYLIKDTISGPGSENHAYTRYMVRILGDQEISPKTAVPVLEKKVARSNPKDFAGAISASIGDTVYFDLVASLHTYIFDYEECYFRFEDTLPAGIDYTSLEVYARSGGTDKEMEEGIDYTKSYDEGTRKATVIIKDIHSAILHATSHSTVTSDQIVVRIQGTMNTNLTIGSAGNVNRAVLYYANDPNEKYDAQADPFVQPKVGQTNNAMADVYSYQVDLLKIDGSSTVTPKPPLAGAKFYMIYRDGENVDHYMKVEDGKYAGLAADKNSATLLTTGPDGKISVAGLASGTYRLREEEAPGGYEPLKNDIIVQYKGALSQDTGALNAINTSVNGADKIEANVSTGIITVTASNHLGASLPETGGMGTTIFYIAGGLMVVAAAAVLVLRKRENG